MKYWICSVVEPVEMGNELGVVHVGAMGVVVSEAIMRGVECNSCKG